MKIKICFTDHRQMTLENVSDYSWNGETHLLSVTIGNYRQFFNTDHIMYVGRVEDLGTRLPIYE